MGYHSKPNRNQNTSKKYNQGFYTPINPQKYIGNPVGIAYLSLWELHVMQYLDTNEKILKWNSEEITIVWRDLQGHDHRYHPDFYYEAVNPKNPDVIDKVVMEVKPHAETQLPVRPKNESIKSLTSYEYKIRTYMKNKFKWSAAKDWCEKRGFRFIIVTEDHLKKANIMK